MIEGMSEGIPKFVWSLISFVILGAFGWVVRVIFTDRKRLEQVITEQRVSDERQKNQYEDMCRRLDFLTQVVVNDVGDRRHDMDSRYSENDMDK